MQIFLALLVLASNSFASSELQLKENFDPDNGSFSRKVISTMAHPKPLEKFLIDGAAHCFRGNYSGVKTLVHQMAIQFNLKEGGLNTFTVDSQTINGELSKLKFTFRMKSGAVWTWDDVQRCK